MSTVMRNSSSSSSITTHDWYELTFRALLTKLDDVHCHSSDEMLSILSAQKNKWLGKVGILHRSPRKSTTTIRSSSAVSGASADGNITHEWELIVKDTSKLLSLDETQALTLLRQGMQYHLDINNEDPRPNDTFKRSLISFYFHERVARLDCLATLLRIADTANHHYQDVALTMVGELVKENVENRIVKQYEELQTQYVSFKERFGDDDSVDSWADYLVAEQASYLEVLFLFYYTYSVCSFEMATQLANVMDVQKFGKQQPLYPYLSKTGRRTAERVSQLCGILMILIMNFENILECWEVLGAEDKWDQSTIASARNKLVGHQLVDNVGTAGSAQLLHHVLKLDAVGYGRWSELPVHGPVLLAWSVFLAHILELGDIVDAESGGVYAAQKDAVVERLRLAMNLNPLVVLQRWLDSMCGPSELAYRQVVKSFMDALFQSTVYNVIVHNDERHQRLYPIFCRVFTGNPALCRNFWESDAHVAVQRPLLDHSVMLFPHNTQRLLSVLDSVGSSKICARSVFAFLDHQLHFYTTSGPPSDVYVTETDEHVITTSLKYFAMSGTTNVSDMLLRTTRPWDNVPVGTIGRWLPNGLAQWRMDWCAWPLLMGRFAITVVAVGRGSTSLSAEDWDSLESTVCLIHRLVSADSGLVAYVDMGLQRAPVDLGLSNPRSLSVIMWLLFQLLVTKEPRRKALLEACSGCLCAMAEYDASECARGLVYINNTVPFVDLLRYVLQQQQQSAEFTVVKSLLMVVARLSVLSVASSTTVLSDLMKFVCTDMFIVYEQWRYKTVVEQWALGSCIQRTFLTIFEAVDSPLKVSIVRLFINEFAMQRALLRPLFDGSSIAKSLHLSNRKNEALQLEELLILSTRVLHRVLDASPDGLRTVYNVAHNAIQAIVHYTGFEFNPELQYLSLSTFTFLCNKQEGGSSLLSYLGVSVGVLRRACIKVLNTRLSTQRVRMAVLELLSAVFAHPMHSGLTEALCKLVHSDSVLDTSKGGDQRKKGPYDESDSVLTPLLEHYVAHTSEMLEKRVNELALVYHMLSSLWQRAPAIAAHLSRMDDFWTDICLPLTTKNVTGGRGLWLVRSSCIDILTTELYVVVPPQKHSAELDAFLDTVSQHHFDWLRTFVRFDLDTKLLDTVEEQAHLLNFHLPHTRTTLLNRSVVLPIEEQFLYQPELIRRVLHVDGRRDENGNGSNNNLVESGGGGDDDESNDFIELVKRANTNWALVDAQFRALHSYRSWMQMLLSKYPTKLDLVPLLTHMISRIGGDERTSERFLISFYLEEVVTIFYAMLYSVIVVGGEDVDMDDHDTLTLLKQVVSALQKLESVYGVTNVSMHNEQASEMSVAVSQLLERQTLRMPWALPRPHVEHSRPIDKKTASGGVAVNEGDDEPSVAVMQGLLASALLLLWWLKHTNVHDVSSDLIPLCCSSLRYKSLLSVSLNVLSVCVDRVSVSAASNDTSPSPQKRVRFNVDYLDSFRHFATVETLFRVFHSPDYDVSTVLSVVQFLQSLSLKPRGAEHLWQHSIVSFICGYKPTSVEVWCGIVKLMSSMVRVLGQNASFLQQALEFLVVFEKRLLSFSEQWNHSHLVVLETVARFIYELGRVGEMWRFMFPDRMQKLQMFALIVSHSLMIRLLNPELLLLLYPDDVRPREWARLGAVNGESKPLLSPSKSPLPPPALHSSNGSSPAKGSGVSGSLNPPKHVRFASLLVSKAPPVAAIRDNHHAKLRQHLRDRLLLLRLDSKKPSEFGADFSQQVELSASCVLRPLLMFLRDLGEPCFTSDIKPSIEGHSDLTLVGLNVGAPPLVKDGPPPVSDVVQLILYGCGCLRDWRNKVISKSEMVELVEVSVHILWMHVDAVVSELESPGDNNTRVIGNQSSSRRSKKSIRQEYCEELTKVMVALDTTDHSSAFLKSLSAELSTTVEKLEYAMQIDKRNEELSSSYHKWL